MSRLPPAGGAAACTAGSRVLLLDDDRGLRDMAADYLRGEGHTVDEAATLEQARAHLAARTYDVVLADVVLEQGTGLDLLREIRRDGRTCDVIIMTGHGGIETAVEAIRQGAYNFITKPLSFARLGLDVAKVLEKRRLAEDFARLSAAGRVRFGGLVGASGAMQGVFHLLERAAAVNTSVLLLGESGTGKEVAARAVHQNSARNGQPFVAVNCAGLPEHLLESELFGHVRGAFTGAERDRKGLFAAADGGTLFLDEIAAAPPRIQIGLLRVLQDRRVRPIGVDQDIDVDVRIIAATSADPDAALAEGALRSDFYYRVAGLVVRLPPLRDRREDIPLLTVDVLEQVGRRLNRHLAVAPRALERLVAHDWPGNVRELEHLLERAALLAGRAVLAERDLGLPPRDPTDSVATLEEVERDHIRSVLARCAGNKLRAAKLLGIPRATLYRKIERHGLEDPSPSGAFAESPGPLLPLPAAAAPAPGSTDH